MKQWLATLAVFSAIVMLTACGTERASVDTSTTESTAITTESESSASTTAKKKSKKTSAKTTTTTKAPSSTASTVKTTQTTKAPAPSASAKTTTTTTATTTTATSKTTTTAPSKKSLDALYGTLKEWVISHGTVKGDYAYYSRSADTYGGYSSEDFSLYYWGDTDKVEFCLHSVQDEEYSFNFYWYIPQTPNGSYRYVTSYYYRATGVSEYESSGSIRAATFTKNYPLTSDGYTGPADLQNAFMEDSRVGLCDALSCLQQFLQKEDIGYTLADLGFTKF